MGKDSGLVCNISKISNIAKKYENQLPTTIKFLQKFSDYDNKKENNKKQMKKEIKKDYQLIILRYHYYSLKYKKIDELDMKKLVSESGLSKRQVFLFLDRFTNGFGMRHKEIKRILILNLMLSCGIFILRNIID